MILDALELSWRAWIPRVLQSQISWEALKHFGNFAFVYWLSETAPEILRLNADCAALDGTGVNQTLCERDQQLVSHYGVDVPVCLLYWKGKTTLCASTKLVCQVDLSKQQPGTAQNLQTSDQ